MSPNFKRTMPATALLLGALLASTTAAGCAPEKPSNARLQGPSTQAQTAQLQGNVEQAAVVEVNGEPVTLAQFNRRVAELPEFARVRYATLAQRQEWLTSIAQFEVMADVAEAQGMGARPQVFYALKQAMADQLLEDVVREKLSMRDIDEAQIQEYYQAHIAEFHTPAARRVALIESPTREQAAQLYRRVLTEVEDAQGDEVNAFRRAAAAYSSDRDVANRGGDIGFVVLATADDAQPAQSPRLASIAEAVAALEHPGEVTPVFALDSGWAVATFIEARDAQTRSLDDAATDIRRRLHQARRQQITEEFIASLRQDARIEHVQTPDDTMSPPARRLREPGQIRLHDAPVFGVEDPAP